MDYEGLLSDLRQIMLRASQAYLRDVDVHHAKRYLELAGQAEDFIEDLKLRKRVWGGY